MHEGNSMEYTYMHSVANRTGYHLVPARPAVVHDHLGLLQGGNLPHAKDRNWWPPAPDASSLWLQQVYGRFEDFTVPH